MHSLKAKISIISLVALTIKEIRIWENGSIFYEEMLNQIYE